MKNNKNQKKASHKLGLPPGTLVHIGNQLDFDTKITVVDYNKASFQEENISVVEDLLKYKNNNNVTLVVVEGLKDIEVIQKIGEMFEIHQLVLEDIVNTSQRPKFEEYDKYLYIVLKSMEIKNDNIDFDYEQLSLLVLDNLVIIFKEKIDDLLHPIKERIKIDGSLIRRSGNDYLTYVILDMIVDQNFVLIDDFDDEITLIEESLLSFEATPEILNKIQLFKRRLITVRRYVSPTRELVSRVIKSESSLIKKKTHIYFQDVYDHIIRITELVDMNREVLSSLFDVYMSNISNKMNEVMKILTIFSTIFIPLTFLAGIYGMNFKFMPELKLKWAYPSLWVAFIVIPIIFVIYFRKKKWL
jgi:magnesium transporter